MGFFCFGFGFFPVEVASMKLLRKNTNPHFIFFSHITKLISLFLKTLLLF